MISINDLTYEIGARALFNEANWHIKPGDKTGLRGANGTGKTTLLKLIVREYTPSGGSISNATDLRIVYLNQDMLSLLPDARSDEHTSEFQYIMSISYPASSL